MLRRSKDGDLFVVWDEQADGGDEVSFVRKYDPSGTLLWEREITRYAGGDGSIAVRDAAIDPGGNLYVTISLHGLSGEAPPDAATVKIDPEGNPVWMQLYDDPVGTGGWFRALGLDASANVYVAGSSSSERGDSDMVTIKYAPEMPGVTFLRGDCNADREVDISDGVCILNWLFLGGSAPGCVAVTNTNGDEDSDISDATYLLNHLFLGGPAPAEPFPRCGPSDLPVDEALGCASPPRDC